MYKLIIAGWIVVLCPGCSREHDDRFMKEQFHILTNLEYLEWEAERRSNVR